MHEGAAANARTTGALPAFRGSFPSDAVEKRVGRLRGGFAAGIRLFVAPPGLVSVRPHTVNRRGNTTPSR